MTAILFLFVGQQALAVGAGITYHGRLIDPSGNPVVGTSVQFKLQIRTPGNENCLMYEEVQVKDLSQGNGVFSVTINDGTGTRTDSSGYSIDQIFANRGTFSFAGGYCVTGNSFAPSPTDGRKIQVYFNDGTFAAETWEPSPPMPINFVPMAIESMQIGGYKKEQLIKLADGVTTTGSELDATKWGNLLALINGTSTAYTKPTDQVTQLYGATIPAPVTGQSIRWNGALNSGAGGWENFTPGAAVSVTNITAGTGLNVGAGPGGSITTTGTLNIDVGTTTGKIVQVAASNKLPAIDGSNLTNINASSVGGTSVSLASLTSGQVLKYNGTNWVNATLVDNDTLGGLSCANGRVAYYTGGSWACLEVANANTANTIVSRDGAGLVNMSTANMTNLKINNASLADVTLSAPIAFTSYSMILPTTKGTSGQVLTTDGASPANLSWSTISATPAGSNGQIQFNNSGSWGGSSELNWDNTNKRVGVGLASPTTKLEVAGTVKVGDGGESCTSTTKGSVRYNSTSNVLEYCNSSSWVSVQTAACSDATPNLFTFSDQANVTINTLTTSDIIQISGINCNVPVSISGLGTPAFRTCSDSSCSSVIQDWTTGTSSISNNQYIQVRQTSDAAGGATDQITVIVGSGASVWSVATSGGDCTGSPAVGTICADGSVYAGLSPDGNVKMYTTRCDYGQTWSGAACTGTRAPQNWNNGSSNWTTTNYTNGNTGKANNAGLVALADAGAPYAAANTCASLNINGHTDWYLPALNELNVLYTGKGAIKNFDTSGSVYWSSTETNNFYAWYERFSDGNQYIYGTKNNTYYIRCVRR